jgi:heptosyltransferase-2
VQSTHLFDAFVSGAKKKMVGIGQDYFGVQIAEKIARRKSFHCPLRANRHKDRGFDGSVGGMQQAGAGAGLCAGGLDFEAKGGHSRPGLYGGTAFRSILKQRGMENRFRRILVRATNWVGDAVMSVPALQALREHNPQARISILARPWVAGLYGRESFCDELIPYEAPRGWKGIGEKRRVARFLRGRKFDCALLLQNAFEAAALVRWAGIPIRMGYDRDARGWLLTHPIPLPAAGETPRHQRFYYLELLKRAKLIPAYENDTPIRLGGSTAAAARGREHFAKSGITGSVVGVSPGAAYGGAKRWLPERFAEAAIAVARERRSHVAVFGSKEEVAICESVSLRVSEDGLSCRNFAGVTPLDEFIEMAAACDLFLTNDSGAMHVASALGVSTVVVFGATDDEATGPTGAWSRVVRQPVDCSPCLLRECPIDHRCMTGVPASRVVEAAHGLVGIERK